MSPLIDVHLRMLRFNHEIKAIFGLYIVSACIVLEPQAILRLQWPFSDLAEILVAVATICRIATENRPSRESGDTVPTIGRHGETRLGKALI